MKGKAYLIARCCVDFCSQRLGFGLGGKEVLGLIQAEAQDLPIQVIVLIPQFVILLWEQSKSTRAKGSTWSHGTQCSLSVSSGHQDLPSVHHC